MLYFCVLQLLSMCVPCDCVWLLLIKPRNCFQIFGLLLQPHVSAFLHSYIGGFFPFMCYPFKMEEKCLNSVQVLFRYNPLWLLIRWWFDVVQIFFPFYSFLGMETETAFKRFLAFHSYSIITQAICSIMTIAHLRNFPNLVCNRVLISFLAAFVF